MDQNKTAAPKFPKKLYAAILKIKADREALDKNDSVNHVMLILLEKGLKKYSKGFLYNHLNDGDKFKPIAIPADHYKKIIDIQYDRNISGHKNHSGKKERIVDIISMLIHLGVLVYEKETSIKYMLN